MNWDSGWRRSLLFQLAAKGFSGCALEYNGLENPLYEGGLQTRPTADCKPAPRRVANPPHDKCTFTFAGSPFER